MSEIKLYMNKSENNKLIKDLVDVATFTGTIKDRTSIINPSVTVKATLQQINSCNYARITDTSRYYFITDKISQGNDIWLLVMRCDVLMSFASEILTNKGLIETQEKEYNLYLNDSQFKVYQNPIVVQKTFLGSDQFNINNGVYVLAVLGGYVPLEE